MRALRDADLRNVGQLFDSEALADQLESHRKKRRYAYLAWLCLGSHYLYLGRPKTQIFFWLTLGGLLIWWLADFMRMPELVEKQNRRMLSQQLSAWRNLFESHAPPAQRTHYWPAAEIDDEEDEEEEDEDIASATPEPEIAMQAVPVARRRLPLPRSASSLVLIGSAVTVIGVYIFAPPPLYPRGAYEPSYRTTRQVNARALPTTASPIHASIAKNVLIRGEIEDVTTEGPKTWLRITQGPHEGRYVALQNLDRR